MPAYAFQKGAAVATTCALVLFSALSIANAADDRFPTVEQGKLDVAFNGDMPGSGLTEDRQLEGLDGELMAWVAEQLDLEVAPHMMEWTAEVASTKTGRVDAMFGMMAWTPFREKFLNITDPIYYVSPGITQPKGQNWSTIEDLKGSTFGTITGFALVPELKRIPGLKLKLYDTTDAAMRDLMAGRVDAIYADPPLAHWAIERNPDWPIHFTPMSEFNPDYPILTGRYGVVFALNPRADKLLEAVNEQIAKLWETCTNWKIAEEYGMARKNWFTPPTTPPKRVGIDRPEGWEYPTLPAHCTDG